ncbi:MAG TPA: DUF5672 family protein [Patescibacteria group bacterium]|nr:DUF5672 family protein [Patescibacteria group bacterium]
MKIAIVIPYYKATLSESEKISYQSYKKYLSKFDTYWVGPTGVRPPIRSAKTVLFDPTFFISVHGYSQLLLTTNFYQAFAKYDYILIFQLDALVFSNSLDSWARNGYDYIGAPLWSSAIGFLSSPIGGFSHVGNGGLSLRRVTTMIQILETVQKTKKRKTSSRWLPWIWFAVAVLMGRSRTAWLQSDAINYPFNEDGFWSFEAQKYAKGYKKPSIKESAKFAIETKPEKAIEILKGQLPFGIHAFDKYQSMVFFKPVSKVV